MIAIPLSEFFTDLITLIQSFSFSFERFLNFVNKKIGLSIKYSMVDHLLTNHQILKIQIFEEDIFSKMPKAWIVQDFLKDIVILNLAIGHRVFLQHI